MYSAIVPASRVKRLSDGPPVAIARSKPRLDPFPLAGDTDADAAPAAPAPREPLRELRLPPFPA